MSYFQHFVKNWRRSARAELPCVGSIEISEGSVASYLNTLGTVGFGLVGAALFIGWERYGEHVLGEETRIVNNNCISYKSSPVRALSYDVKKSFTYDLPRIGKALYVAPLHIARTMVKGDSHERVNVVRDGLGSLWTGVAAESLAYIPASIIVEKIIPVGKDLSLKEPEYWLSWIGALLAGWIVGTIGIATKLAWDDHRNERKLR